MKIFAGAAALMLLATAGSASAQAYYRRGYVPAPVPVQAPCPPAGGYYNSGYAGGAECVCNQPATFYTNGGYPGYGGQGGGYNVVLRAPGGTRIYGQPVMVPSGVVTVQSAPIYVQAPPVRVASPQIYLQRPQVIVQPSQVTVDAPTVHMAGCGPGQQCDSVGSSSYAAHGESSSPY